MNTFLENFALAFVQLFFAVDAIGVLPMFVSLTEKLDPGERRKAVSQMVATAMIVGVLFLFCGHQLLRWIGLELFDFMIAGGTMLFLIAIGDLFSGRTATNKIGSAVGAVPLGTPLIVGPAVMTMLLMLVDPKVCGPWPTLAALLVNVLLAGLFFRTSELAIRLLGKTGVTVTSKVASLILAAIAVMMIRKGIQGLFPMK